jgi:hypothetical protein
MPLGCRAARVAVPGLGHARPGSARWPARGCTVDRPGAVPRQSSSGRAGGRRPVRERAPGSPGRPGRSALRESRKPPRCASGGGFRNPMAARGRISMQPHLFRTHGLPLPVQRRGSATPTRSCCPWSTVTGMVRATRSLRAPVSIQFSTGPGAVGMSASDSEVVSVSSASPSRRRSPAARTSLRRAPADGTRSVSATEFPEPLGGHRATRAAGRPSPPHR